MNDRRHHAFKLVANIDRPKANCLHAIARGNFVTSSITLRIVAQLVRQTVNLDRQCRCNAKKIERERIVRSLTAEAKTTRPGPQRGP